MLDSGRNGDWIMARYIQKVSYSPLLSSVDGGSEKRVLIKCKGRESRKAFLSVPIGTWDYWLLILKISSQRTIVINIDSFPHSE